MAVPQKVIPFKGGDLDNDYQYVDQDHSPFIKDLTYNTNSRGNNAGTQGAFTPNEGSENYVPAILLPPGINHKVGDYESEQLGQTFLWYWNSANQHTMWRIIGETGTVELIKQDPNFKFKRDPKNFISTGRCTVQTVCRFDKKAQAEEQITYVIFTDNDKDIMFICVEDCIKTDGFTGAFFDTDPDARREDWLLLGIPTPLDCIKVVPVVRDITDTVDRDLANTMKYGGWQFRIKGTDAWARDTEHGFMSDRYYPFTGNTCIGESPGLPRCVDLTFKAGSPFWEKIQVEFRKCSANVRGFSIVSDWFLYDTFDKYDNCDPANRWERNISNPWQENIDLLLKTYRDITDLAGIDFTTAPIKQIIIDIGVTFLVGYVIIISDSSNPLVNRSFYIEGVTNTGPVYTLSVRNLDGTPATLPAFTGPGHVVVQRLYTLAEATADSNKKGLTRYNDVDNTFTYRFCNSKECTALPVEETNRTMNSIPLTSSSVFSIGREIGTARNTRGFEPIDCNELDKVAMIVTKPTNVADSCKPIRRKVIIYGIIKAVFDNYVVPLRSGAAEVIYGAANGNKNSPYSFDQVLPAGQEGIIGYFAGTKNYCISKQYRKNEDDTYTYTGVPFVYSAPHHVGAPRAEIPVQRWEFDVIPGKYVFRVASHSAIPTDDYQRTSEVLAGSQTAGAGTEDESQEIIIDVCDADYTTANDKYLVILDLTREEGHGNASAVIKGYLREDEVDKLPIDHAKILSNVQSSHHLRVTDHNGFFWGATLQNHYQLNFRGKKSCVPDQPLGVTETTVDDFPGHYRVKDVFVYKILEKYPDMDRIHVKGRLALCDNPNIGVSGAAVVLTNGQWAVTDVNGSFTIITHDNIDSLPRTEQLVYTQRGPCQLQTCTKPECVWCFPLVNVTYPVCSGDAPRNVTVPDLLVNIAGLNKRGPQNGGRYGIGMEFFDNLSRHDFIQIRDKHYVDIPTLQQTGVFDFSTISFSIPADFQVPSRYRKMCFYITENLNWDDFITIVAERIQFVDNTGYTNDVAPTQIRLYYENLNEYNKQNNFSTNYIWQFLTDKNASVTGDQVEFIMNGDGIFFPNRITAQVKFDKEGKYIQIDYSEELKDIKDGALLKLIRPKQCVDKNFFYSMCPMIDLVDGKPTQLTGTFNYFDSFLFPRQLPVPVLIETKSTDPDSGKEIITSTTQNKITDYGYLFEHHSPSDFWGDHCWNKGWPDVVNPYESQQCNVMEIALSKALANNGVLNGLNSFYESDITKLNEQEWGGIIAVLVELNYLLVLCDKDNFVVMFDDNTLRLNKLGQVIASSAESLIGKPERKIGNNYGCDMSDINTIRKRQGLVVFVDRSKGVLVIHNYGEAAPLSDNLTSEYMRKKIKAVANTPGRYFHSIIDPRNSQYLLTSFDIKDAYAPEDFLNILDHDDPGVNETMVWDIASKMFKGFIAPTPEGWASLGNETSDQQLFGFKQGSIWKFHSTNVPYLNYFGVQCAPYIWAVANIENTKIKRFQWNEVYCPAVIFHAYKIVTQSGQESRILPGWWDKRETFYTSAFLCDLNTKADPNLPVATGPNKILDGDFLSGSWLAAGYTVKDYDGRFFKLTAIIIFMLPVEKSSTQ